MSPAKAGPPHARSSRIRDDLKVVVSPIVAEAGYDLEELSVRSVGRRNLVRVVVDSDKGVDLDAVATISRSLSDALDAEGAADGFSESYVLEVTSPGVDRPLTEPRHWRRATGRLVKVSVAGDEVVGRIVATSDAGVELDVAGTGRVVSYGELGGGRVQVEFNRAGALPHDDGDEAEEA